MSSDELEATANVFEELTENTRDEPADDSHVIAVLEILVATDLSLLNNRKGVWLWE